MINCLNRSLLMTLFMMKVQFRALEVRFLINKVRNCALSSSSDTIIPSYEYHTPVMLSECMQYLNISNSKVFIDGTLGGGGHTHEILKRGGKVIALDQDPDAIQRSSKLLQNYLDIGSLEIHQVNFRDMLSVLSTSKLANSQPIDGVLLDLGISSYQIDESSRGFSFAGDGPLDMRMDRGSGVLTSFSAATIINEWSVEDVADVLFYYGEERRSRRIAHEITLHRPIHTTGQLEQVISRITSFKERPKTLARCFQGLRIRVNEELSVLDDCLSNLSHVMKVGGRLVVMSYHSLEDRRIKRYMKGEATTDLHDDDNEDNDKRFPPASRIESPASEASSSNMWKILTKRPVTPRDEEIAHNRRARSAKLRCAERIDPKASKCDLRQVDGSGKRLGAKQLRKLRLLEEQKDNEEA